MHKDWEYEFKKLEYIKELIKNDLEKRINADENISKELRSINKDMWEEAGALSGNATLEEAPTFLQGIMLLKQKIISSTENKKRIYRLQKQIETPYFCRIDFKEDDYILENIYIGIYGLRLEETGEIIIYDWRAPISSIFYDFEPGRVMYESPSGIIEGELFLKRQYRIERGNLILMFDSSIAIEDDILQDILAQSSTNKMKTIVSTIQREQNRVIRYEGKRIMIVQGPAGSGKTSIALHRAAYLLYKHRDNIKADNILLYTPNASFIEYISSVLPELGEEELRCTTIVDLAKRFLPDDISKFETYSEMMEWKLANVNNNTNRMKIAKFKASQEFTNVLDGFLEKYEKELLTFNDIKNLDSVLIKKEEITELFHNSFKHMPIYKRLQRIKNIIWQRFNEFEKLENKNMVKELEEDPQYMSNAERKALSRSRVKKDMKETADIIEEMFEINILKLYTQLFKEAPNWGLFTDRLEYKELTESVMSVTNSVDNNVLFFEDQAPLLYLMVSLGMIDPDRNIKQIIIDEAQDYSITAFKLFAKLYSECNITILGDVNQNINPINGIKSLSTTGELIDKPNYEYIELNKSYRSTLEIMNFAAKLLPVNTIPYGRNGKKPELIFGNSQQEIVWQIIGRIQNLNKKYNSIAVIGRTLRDCKIVFDYLGEKFKVKLIKNGDEEIKERINIIPSYLSKGMEFDVVIAVIFEEDDYIYNERELLYTVCTRALHILDIFALKNSKILKKFS